MKRVVPSIIAACLLASASPAAAQIINGGFEEGAFGDGSVRQILPGEEALPGWTVNDSPVAWYTNGYEPPNALKPIGVAPDTGTLAMNLGDGSVRVASISQTFTVLPFIEQQVSFWLGNFSANGGAVSIGVTIQDRTSNTILWGETAMPPRPISIRHGSNSLIRSSRTEGRIRSVFRRSGAAIRPASTTSPPWPSLSLRPGLWRCSALRAWA